MGRRLDGTPAVEDLARLHHLLLAGSRGSWRGLEILGELVLSTQQET